MNEGMINNTVTTIVEPTQVTKVASNPDGVSRIEREFRALSYLAGTGCVANVISRQIDTHTAHLVLERFEGSDLKSWLQLTDGWRAKKIAWVNARDRLEAYIELEMRLLTQGVMYRDLNLEHVLFTDAGARMIDLEASLLGVNDARWALDSGASHRGTWETMALEEFRRPAILDMRTATYRTAVVAYLALTGELPFVRKPRKHDTYKWRKTHAAEIDQGLPRLVRRVFAAALSREPSHRYKTPETFFAALTVAYDALS